MKKEKIEKKNLGPLLTLKKGKKPKSQSPTKEKGMQPYVDIKAFETGVIDNYTDDDKCLPCNDGDLLIVCDGSRSGYVGRAIKGYTGSTLAKISAEGVDNSYLYYFIQSMYRLLNTQMKGTGTPHLNADVLRNAELVIPSIPEQKRIVNKIEELFSELDSAVETLKKTKEQLAVYRQSVLKEAFEREKDGKFLKIKDFANVGTGATPLKTRQDYYNGDIAWVSSGKVNDKKIYTPTAYITEKALEETNCSVYPAHTIVVAMYGEGKTRGQCAELMIDAATNQALAAIVLQDNAVICKDFLLWFLTFNYEELRRKAAGGVQPNLNLNLVKTISVPYCDMDTQMKIISEIESKLTVCENIEKTVNDALIQADAMRQSILKKAFEGSL